jgi:alpha-beta hydrolase superfamily lysophospholipase
MLVRVAIVVVALGMLAATTASARSGTADCLRPSDHATTVHFPAAGGARLYGAVLGRGTTGVVFAHQVAADHCQWLPFARQVVAKGYRALVFDMRGYGKSTGVTNSDPQLDVKAAAAALRRRGAKRIILVGASMGATGVLSAAPNIRPAINGVIELSAPTLFGSADALTAVRRLERPALFIAGRDDGDFASASRALYKAAATKDKGLIIASNSWHGVDLTYVPAVKRRMFGFIRRVG